MKRWLPDAAALAGAVGTILLAIGAWLLVPRERASAKPTKPALRVCLVDVSSSAIATRPWRDWIDSALEEQATAAGRDAEEFCTILFGDEVRRTFGPAAARSFRLESALPISGPSTSPHYGSAETHLASALETVLALAEDPARAGCTLDYFGDDTFTGRDPRPRWATLAERGVRLVRVELPPPDRQDLVVGALTLPREVEPGAPISADVEIFYAPVARRPAASTVYLDCTCEFDAGMTRKRLEVEVPRGLAPDADGYLRWRVRAELGRGEPGLTKIRLQGARQDSTALINRPNSREGFVRCKGRLIVGVVGESPLPSAPGIQIEKLSANELGSRLDVLDALVTCNMPLESLPTDVVGSFLRRGGGWLCLAGNLFLPGFVAGRAGSALELLPLQPPDENPDPRDVVVLADRSGSMTGEPFENVGRALLALVDAAHTRDAVELRFFGETLSDPIPLKAAFDPRPSEQILRDAQDRFRAAGGPGGRTAIARSLEAFASERERSGRESLVFVLTDGRDTVDADATERCANVLPRLLAARARIVVLEAGDEPEQKLLSTLVAPGEKLRALGKAPGFWSLAEIFRREVSADRTREGPELRVLPARQLLDPTAPPSLGSDVLRAQHPDASASWPPIQRYTRAKPAPGAEVLWSSEKGEPLLAIQRVGAGASAACAFAPIAEWGPDWAKRADLWAPLLRALARGKREDAPDVRVDGDELIVENLPAGAPADLEARIFAADARPSDAPAVALPLSAPTQGADPRRVRTARWPDGGGLATLDLRGDADLRQGIGLDDPILPRIEIRARGADASWPAIVLPFPAPRSPEFILPRPRMDWSARSPQASGPAGPVRSARPHPSAPWVLISGLLLLTIAGLAGAFARRSR